MSNNKRNDNSKSNSNYIYPQPYIDPMVYLNPYYSNATGYQNNSQGYVEYTNPNNGYVDYSQFNDNPANTYPDQNYINNNTYDSGGEYTNIPAEDFNIPSVPYFQQPNIANPQQNIPNMICSEQGQSPLNGDIFHLPEGTPFTFSEPYRPSIRKSIVFCPRSLCAI